jgi:hypothetical protein
MEKLNVFVSTTTLSVELRQMARAVIEGLQGFTVEISDLHLKKPGEFDGEFLKSLVSRVDVMVLVISKPKSSFLPSLKISLPATEIDLFSKAGKPIILMQEDFDWDQEAGPQFAEHLAALERFRIQLGPEDRFIRFRSVEEFQDLLIASLLKVKKWRFEPTFDITFDPGLSEHQVRAAFEALADYYRACGGVGLSVDFQQEEIEAGAMLHA